MGAMRLAPLANASGGAILLLEDFGEPFVSNVSAAVRRSGSSAGHGALLSVRASPGVACTRVIGAAEAMASDAAAAATAPSLPALTGDGEINLPVEDTSDVFRLKSTDPSQVRLSDSSATCSLLLPSPRREDTCVFFLSHLFFQSPI